MQNVVAFAPSQAPDNKWLAVYSYSRRSPWPAFCSNCAISVYVVYVDCPCAHWQRIVAVRTFHCPHLEIPGCCIFTHSVKKCTWSTRMYLYTESLCPPACAWNCSSKNLSLSSFRDPWVLYLYTQC